MEYAFDFEEFEDGIFDDFLQDEFEDDLEDEFPDEDEFEPIVDELLEDAVEGDPDAEDEFFGALAGLAAKALPAIAGTVVPQIFKFGRRLISRIGSRRRRRRVLRRFPRIIGRSVRILRRHRRRGRNPRFVRRVLHRCARPPFRRFR